VLWLVGLGWVILGRGEDGDGEVEMLRGGFQILIRSLRRKEKETVMQE